jgi:carbon storage regulator CsrA
MTQEHHRDIIATCRRGNAGTSSRRISLPLGRDARAVMFMPREDEELRDSLTSQHRDASKEALTEGTHMLVLIRKMDEQIVLRIKGEMVVVHLLGIDRGKVRVGITARRSVQVYREEIARRMADWEHDLDELLAEPMRSA